MFGDIMLTVSAVSAALSAIISLIALTVSINNQKKIKAEEKKQLTIEAFNQLQEQVLDKLASVDRENAELIVENRYKGNDFKQAYNDYKTLIARLEHFAIGVNEGVYDFDIVNKLAGEHLVFLYPKIEPIIDEANKSSADNKYYQEYRKLCNRKSKND